MTETNGLTARVTFLEKQFEKDTSRIISRLDNLEKDIQSLKIEMSVLIARLGVLRYFGGLCVGGIATLIVRSFY